VRFSVLVGERREIRKIDLCGSVFVYGVIKNVPVRYEEMYTLITYYFNI